MNEPAWRGLRQGGQEFNSTPEAPNIPPRKTSDLTPPPRPRRDHRITAVEQHNSLGEVRRFRQWSLWVTATERFLLRCSLEELHSIQFSFSTVNREVYFYISTVSRINYLNFICLYFTSDFKPFIIWQKYF